MHRKGGHVVLGHAFLAELPDEVPGIRRGNLEDGEAPDVGENRIPHRGGQVVELCKTLGS